MSVAAGPRGTATVGPVAPRRFARRAALTIPRRRAVSGFMVGLTYVAAGLAMLPLVLIFGYLLVKGASTLSLDFFTKCPPRLGRLVAEWRTRSSVR
jgi:hypothetical protein